MDSIYKIENNLKMLNKFEKFLQKYKNNIIFVCVGNSDVWYDSFGPIVGSLLIKNKNFPCFVYGNINKNIKLNNLNNYINWIKLKHFDKKIVVIDAALSENDTTNLVFKEGAIKCAYFSNKSIAFGDFSILCPIQENSNNIDSNYKKIVNNCIITQTIINKYMM